jgi:hypothetical protein
MPKFVHVYLSCIHVRVCRHPVRILAVDMHPYMHAIAAGLHLKPKATGPEVEQDDSLTCSKTFSDLMLTWERIWTMVIIEC